MNAARARRRWLAWCRYVDKTQSRPRGNDHRPAFTHIGQAKAYQDAMFAGRAFPHGVRYVYFPKWGTW